MPGGRPTKYSKSLAALICERVATHRHGLKKLCSMFDDMPEHSTITAWRFKYPEFSGQYLDAKRAQIDLVMEELDEIIEDSLVFYHDSEGNERIDSPSATVAIAKANNRKWFASKLAPQLYGDGRKDDEKNNEKSVLEKIISGEIKIKHD